MDYKCFNCEETNELADCINSLTEVDCWNCHTTLYLDIYKQCSNCLNYFLTDYMKCPECLKDYSTEKINADYIYVKTNEDYENAISFINSEKLLGLDTEGNSLDPYTNQLLLVQIGNEHVVYIFDFSLLKKLSKESFWFDHKKLFILHNAKYDYKVLKHSMGIELLKVYDTYLAERILTCGIERRNSLKEVTKKYLDLLMDKTIRDEFITMTFANFASKINQQLIDYSAMDVSVLPRIYSLQKWELERQDLLKIAEVEFEISKVVGEMELKGIYVDVESWNSIIAFCKKKKAEIEDSIHNLLIDLKLNESIFGEININLNSTKDLKAIFQLLGFEISSTGDADLAQINHPLAGLLREYRGFEKQLSSFGEKFLELVKPRTSRVYPSFNQIGADTGRFSCNNPNLQQIPASEEYRRCFKAPKGRKLISCDYSQQELRILASLSGDPKFIKFYEDGVDLHTATASMMFNIPMEKVEKETHRKVAKTINFGLAYGQGAKKLGLTIGVDEHEAENMIEKYFSQFTFIRDWLSKAAADAQLNGYSTTLMGRKRFYKIPKENDPDYRQLMSSIGRQGKNSPIQGSGVDMIKIAMIDIHKQLRKAELDAFLINVVHDELIVEASEKDADAASIIVKNSMIAAGKLLAPNVPILAEEGIGDYWKH